MTAEDLDKELEVYGKEGNGDAAQDGPAAVQSGPAVPASNDADVEMAT